MTVTFYRDEVLEIVKVILEIPNKTVSIRIWSTGFGSIKLFEIFSLDSVNISDLHFS